MKATFIAVLGALALGFVTSPTWAEVGAGLSYTVPEGCPSQAEFVAAVTAHGARFDDPLPENAERVMVVSIQAENNGFVGSFLVRDTAGTTNQREVRDPSCRQVVDALAVVTAIALRPEVTRASAVPVWSAPPPPDLSVASPGAMPGPAPTPLAEPELHGLRGHTEYGTKVVQVAAGKLRFDSELALSAYAGATLGVIPSLVMPRFDIAMTRANFVTTPEGVSHLVGGVLRSRFTVFGPSTYHSRDTLTDALGLSAALGGCSTPLYDTSHWVLLYCGEIGMGIMHMETTTNDGKKALDTSAPFGTAGFELEAQYRIGSWFHVGALFGIDGSTRFSAERADGSRIFQSSFITGHAALGLGLQF